MGEKPLRNAPIGARLQPCGAAARAEAVSPQL
jgi:hypothetical protein